MEADTAEVIRAAWDFGDPKASEARFRELAQQAKTRGDASALLELETQAARAQGLDRRYEEAHATLDAVEAKLPGQPPVVRLRYLLERGRVLNSSGQAGQARLSFEQAWQLGREAHLDGLAVDAAHMVAITFLAEPDTAIAWNGQALELARASSQPGARRWLASLLNNQAWSYLDRGDAARALSLVEEGLVVRRTQDNAEATRIAQWSVARAQRALGQNQKALETQQALATEYAANGKPSGFVFEELAECYLALGDTAHAKEYFAQTHAELSRDEEFARSEAARLERMARLGGIAPAER